MRIERARRGARNAVLALGVGLLASGIAAAQAPEAKIAPVKPAPEAAAPEGEDPETRTAFLVDGTDPALIETIWAQMGAVEKVTGDKSIGGDALEPAPTPGANRPGAEIRYRLTVGGFTFAAMLNGCTAEKNCADVTYFRSVDHRGAGPEARLKALIHWNRTYRHATLSTPDSERVVVFTNVNLAGGVTLGNFVSDLSWFVTAMTIADRTFAPTPPGSETPESGPDAPARAPEGGLPL